jgi:hypothetical protein
VCSVLTADEADAGDPLLSSEDEIQEIVHTSETTSAGMSLQLRIAPLAISASVVRASMHYHEYLAGGVSPTDDGDDPSFEFEGPITDEDLAIGAFSFYFSGFSLNGIRIF